MNVQLLAREEEEDDDTHLHTSAAAAIIENGNGSSILSAVRSFKRFTAEPRVLNYHPLN